MNNRDITSTTATTNHTTNYDLPLWESGDITSWQGNLNDAFNKIDTAMFENKTEMLGYKEIADKLEETNESSMQVFDTLNQKAEDNAAKIAALETKTDETNTQVTANSTAINQLRDEDETVKTQMDSMQDDIGKLMDWHTGVSAYGVGNLPGVGDRFTIEGRNFRILDYSFSSSTIDVWIKMECAVQQGSINTRVFIPEEISAKIFKHLNLVNPIFVGNFEVTSLGPHGSEWMLTRLTGAQTMQLDIATLNGLYPNNMHFSSRVYQRGE